jgi:hypothetical protein
MASRFIGARTILLPSAPSGDLLVSNVDIFGNLTRSRISSSGAHIQPSPVFREGSEAMIALPRFFTKQTFLLRDFYLPSRKVVFEVDGSTHGSQLGYDAECDAFLKATGIRTVRISNATVMRNPRAAMTIMKAELGL